MFFTGSKNIDHGQSYEGLKIWNNTTQNWGDFDQIYNLHVHAHVAMVIMYNNLY